MDLLQAIQNSAHPLLSAHRGGKALYPENTMLAFRESVTVHNVDMLEFDLQLTKDGKAVVIHDPTLNRTTNGSETFVILLMLKSLCWMPVTIFLLMPKKPTHTWERKSGYPCLRM